MTEVLKHKMWNGVSLNVLRY